MRAIEARAELELLVFAAGAHLLGPARTISEVEAAVPVAATIPMQREGEPSSQLADALALARGVEGFARAISERQPHWVVVLGDRIEAFAAACAASVGGAGLAHIHGGDRAEGVADEAMRGAVAKLAHLHFPATPTSADRLLRMGEDPRTVHCVGSPALDALAEVEPLDDEAYTALGRPRIVLLLHPVGRTAQEEARDARACVEAIEQLAEPALALAPNRDPGFEGVDQALRAAALPVCEHLPRPTFLALLKRLVREGGALLGNSSAGRIEAAALGLAVVDVGSRQQGREEAGRLVRVALEDRNDAAAVEAVAQAVRQARALPAPQGHPFGDGEAGRRIAVVLAREGPPDWRRLRKRNSY